MIYSVVGYYKINMNEIFNISFLPSLLMIVILALVHASFQVSISVLTLMSGHILGRGSAAKRLSSLAITYTLGVITATITLMAVTLYGTLLIVTPSSLNAAWAIAAVIASIVASIIAVYYTRPGKGTRLWVPRNLSTYFVDRAEKTKNPFESFSLGIMTVVAELPFTAIAYSIAALLLAESYSLNPSTVLALIYCLVTTLPLIIITLMILSGFKLSVIQRWRESNKYFLQFFSAVGLCSVALFIAVYKIGFRGQL